MLCCKRTAIALLVASAVLYQGCALTATRPIQEMSDTAAALKAAREVKADTLAPELFREAKEKFFKARKDYKFKNFYEAKEYAEEARELAEKAEYVAIKQGAVRGSLAPPDPLTNAGSKLPPKSDANEFDDSNTAKPFTEEPEAPGKGPEKENE